jgi:hypothetical protein
MAKELIDFLDLINGDPDFENELLDDDSEPDEDDEPSLGWTDDETIFGNYAGTFGVDNKVDDYEGRVAKFPIHT